MEEHIGAEQFAAAFGKMIEDSQALEKMYSLIGLSAGTGEADMEASLMLECVLLLRERGVDVSLRQRCCLVVEEDSTNPTMDALYTLVYAGVDIDAMGRTDIDAIADAWFSHYYEGRTYGGIADTSQVSLPFNPVRGKMQEHLVPYIGDMVARLQAQAMELATPASVAKVSRRRI